MIAIPSVDLRLRCSQYVYQQLGAILIPLTQTIIEIMVDYSSPPTLIPTGDVPNNGNENQSPANSNKECKEAIWTACTIKELTFQHPRTVFPWSEKIYYLYKMVMVCIVVTTTIIMILFPL